VRRLVFPVLLAGLLALMATVAVAATWSDLDSGALQPYGISQEQVAGISQGFPDGSWRPYEPMPRRQFVRLAMRLFELQGVAPSAPTFSDVPPAHDYFRDIEGAVWAGLVQGVGGSRFAPDQIVSREQGVAVVARRLASVLQVDLASAYPPARQAGVLGAFSDESNISAVLRPELAFAVERGVLRGNAQGQLSPRAQLTRIQGAALLIRARPLLPTTTTTTGAPAPVVFGLVLGRDGVPVVGGSVAVERTGSGGVKLGQAVTNAEGRYSVALSGVALGTSIDVIATAPGYTSVFVYGVYDEVRERVDFVDFGSSGGDRRLPLGTGGIPPFPFSGLLPD
jgi:hypothetical protein